MRKALSQLIGISFLYYLTLIELPLLLSPSSYHTVAPKTRKERALRHPHKSLHPWLRPKQPRKLPRNIHVYIAHISNHVPRRRARRSELRVRSLVSCSLFLEIDLRRTSAVVGSICSECIRFSEKPCELPK